MIPGIGDDPRDEDMSLQQCKRSQFYIMVRTIKADVLASFSKQKKRDPKNTYQCLELLNYILDNLMGLAGLWTCLIPHMTLSNL